MLANLIYICLMIYSGELSVEIPVKICHPASLTPAPKPKLDQNHLPHQYNIVDDDLDLDNYGPTKSNRRIGSNASLAVSTRYDPDGQDQQDDLVGVGRQGEWNGDDRGLSPANSITSIKSLLASPKQKLSKLADKIQRSTSPTTSGHIQHEHRKDSDNLSGAPSRRMAKSPPLGPAAPVAYVPAVERVRYTPFQPPPTTKAKEFLKAAAQYQQEMSGALAAFGGDDNVEFDLDDKAMATAIHQWISKKESEGRYQNQAPLRAPTATRPTPPIQIPASSNRRRHPVEPINTQVGSFTSQISPGGASPQSYYSPASPEPSSPTAAAFSNQTTSRFIHHAHRQPAAPQTGAFGSAVEDCMTDPPLFARPLPLPSPPPTGSPKRPGLPNPPAQSRPISPSPVPIPIQTAESLALAREAYERVKRAGSPVPDPLQNATTPGSGAPHSGFVASPHQNPSSFDSNRHHQHQNIKVPAPVNAVATQANMATSPSGLSRLLNDPASAPGAQLTHHVKHGYDGHLIDNSPPPTCSSPELRHIPLNRPLPMPGPKPQHLNQIQAQPPAQIPARSPVGSNPNIFTREAEARPRPEPTSRPPITATPAASTAVPVAATTTSSGHLRGPQPVMEEGATRSGHLYTPKPTPTLTARPPAPVTTARVGQHAAPSNKPPTVSGASVSASASAQAPATRATAGHARKPVVPPAGAAGKPQDPGSGFIYPKATRKPVAGTKPPMIAAKPPMIAAKPKNLASATQQHAHITDPPGPDHTTSRPVMDAAAHQEFDQRLRRLPQEGIAVSKSKGENLAPTASMRAPQMIAAPSPSLSSPPSEDVERRSVSPRGDRSTHVTRGFHSPRDAILEEEPGEVDKGWSAVARQQRGPTEGSRGAVSEDPRHLHHQQQQQRYQSYEQHRHTQAQGSPQDDNSNISGPPANQALDDEIVQETPSEIRAHAIAAANSFRAKGANSGGYVVNTSKLRQAIRNTDNNNSGGSSGHLIQALADGAMSAASAAASGLGWGGQQSSSPPSKQAPIAAPRPSAQHRDRRSGQSPQRSSSPPAAQGRPIRPQQQQQQQSPPKSRHLDRAAPGRSRHHQNPVFEQVHDLTMKDINFQTLAPGEHVFEQQPTAAAMFDLPLPEVNPIPLTATPETVTGVAPTSMAAAPTTAMTTIPVTSIQHQAKVTQRVAAVTTAEDNSQQKGPAQSRSQPASRVMDTPSRNDPLSPTPITVAVEAHPDPTTTPTTSVIAPPRLDKTLPKIQEQPAPRSRILDHPPPQRQQSPPTETPIRPSAAPRSATAAIFNSNNIHIPPLAKAAPPLTPAQQQRARYYYGRAAESSATSGATALAATGPAASSAYSSAPGGGVGGAKAINPKLQEYIQKYNLAANTRS